MKHHVALGFTGAMGSVDVTHMHWGRAPYSHRQLYIGKKGFAAIAYKAIVNHRGQVMAMTEGFPGAQNDKSIVRLDSAVQAIRKDEPYTLTTDTLSSENGAKEGKEAVKMAVHLIVDSGYHRVRECICECTHASCIGVCLRFGGCL